MSTIKEALARRIPERRKEIADLVARHGDAVISQVTVKQAFGGMRGVKGLVCDTSLVDPEKGLIIRGIPIAELADRTAEEIFFLLVVGELPTAEELKTLKQNLFARSEVPDYVWNVLHDMPPTAHPMDMLITAITILEDESVFRKRYDAGMKKEEYWEAALEDSLNLLAKLPALAAGVYRIRYKKGELILPDPGLDWSQNYAHMLGIDAPDFHELIRLYMVLHSDHEGGNVSAFAAHVVASALSDPYYALAAGLSGLAGPLHGLANQECLKFVLGVMDRFGGAPTPEQMEAYTWEVLRSGRVVPGYGHAVLRATDPRFTAFHAFGKERFPNDSVFKTVDVGFQVIPKVLQEHGKATNPWPNVDAGSGALLYHFGIEEMRYYTVLFSVSRAMGIFAQLITSRAMMEPITRPKSVSTAWIASTVGAEIGA
ncbi:MAG TPA: citrate (Si)-synthase [Longimicrobiales bacterium]|nr:citrate (Si)-synthase [Longimicrobiales bacterium]